MAVILLGNGVSISIFVLAIFVRKIKNTMDNIDPLTSLKAEQHVNMMTNVVAKHGLLFGIAILINPLYLIIIALSTLDVIGGFYSFFTDIGTALTQSIEGTVIVLVLWLILRINYDKYICLCKGCHFVNTIILFEQIESIPSIGHMIELLLPATC